MCKYFHAVRSAVILNNRKHLCWSSSIWVTRHTWATAEEMAQKSVSACLMVILKAISHHYQHLSASSPVPGCCPQLEQTRVFGRLHTTPSPKSGAAHELHQEGVGAQTPDTPELYSALNLSYNSRSAGLRNQSSEFGKMDEWKTSLWTLVHRSKSCGLLIRLHSSVLLQKQWDRGSVRIVGQSLSSEAVGFQTFSALQLPSR